MTSQKIRLLYHAFITIHISVFQFPVCCWVCVVFRWYTDKSIQCTILCYFKNVLQNYLASAKICFSLKTRPSFVISAHSCLRLIGKLDFLIC